MLNKSKIETFVEKILNFKPDGDLKLSAQLEENGIPIRMAAAGKASVDNEKIGTLISETEHFLVRVFNNKKLNQFDLFFISDSGSVIPFVIIHTGNSFKYFITDQDGRAAISKTDKIDPLKDKLSFTLPQLKIEHKTETLYADQKQFIVKADGFTLSGNLDEKRLNLKIDNSANEVVFTKLLINAQTANSEDLFIRLLPIVNRNASIKIPDNLAGTMQICFYR